MDANGGQNLRVTSRVAPAYVANARNGLTARVKSRTSVAVEAGSVWVTNHCDGTVSRIDPDTDTVVKTIDVGFYPQWWAAGGGFVWVGVSGNVLFEMGPAGRPS